MEGGIHMGATVHDPLKLGLIEAVLGVEFFDMDIDSGSGWPLRHMVAPGLAEIVYFQAHDVLLFAR
jgi:hypothetical protein